MKRHFLKNGSVVVILSLFFPSIAPCQAGSKITQSQHDFNDQSKTNSPSAPPPQRIFAAPSSFFWAKFKHRNDPAGEKKMQDSLTLLSTFSDAGTGITKQLENNSDAFMKFGQTVDEVRESVSENDFSANFGTNNWAWLETNFYGAMGFTNFQNETTRDEVRIHLAARLTYLGTLASAYKALLLGDQLLAQTAVGSLKKASNVVAQSAGMNATNPATAASSTQKAASSSTNAVENFSVLAVLGFVNSIWGAWDNARTNAQSVKNVSVQLDELYREIDATTNSTAVILLVPTIGTGLDDTSILLLSNHVTELRYNLLTNFIDTFCTTNLPTGWSSNSQLVQFSNACYAVISNFVDPSVDMWEWWHKNQGARETLITNYTLSTYSEIYYQTEPLLRPAGGMLAPKAQEWEPPDPWKEAYRHRNMNFKEPKSSESAASAISGANLNPKINIAESNQMSPIIIAFTNAINHAVSAEDIKKNSKSLGDLLNDLQNLAASLSISSANVKGLLSLTGTSEGSGTNFFNTFTNLLLNTNIFGPSLREGLGKPLIASDKLGSQTLQAMQNLLQQTSDYEQGRENLFKNFFTEIAGIRTQLRQEDLRHDQALSLVLAKEIQRWTILAMLLSKYEGEFGNQGWLFARAMPDGKAGVAQNPEHSWLPIARDDRILPSLRLLAYTAYSSQREAPTNDPGGWAVIAYQQRLVASLELLQGYFLMASFNQRYSLANQRLLNRELDEHVIQMQAIEARAHESEIELMLGDQLAFQKTGWTQADIDTLLRLAQTVGVGWIAGKQ